MSDEFFIQPKAYEIGNPYHVVVKSNTRITPDDARDDVHEIILDIQSGSFSYIEGQSIGVLAPPPYDFGSDHHMRLYSIASTRRGEHGNSNEVAICVQRCFYIDDISGERYPGKCSNYLCDLKVGDEVAICGPYGQHFIIPKDKEANILMIASGTGIAPFRAFIKHVFEEEDKWIGEIRLFYEAATGLDFLYMNQIRDDIKHHYLESTFKAVEALAPQSVSDESPNGLMRKLEESASDVWTLVQHPKTHVYVAGMRKASKSFNEALSHIAESEEKWLEKKKQLFQEGRWAEHLYD
uniref:Ferredoxin--NADP+ reductase n=1 Tax=Candidatus Kentrum sp. MB TaxID=2138164 RepID=A0A450XMG4_9GAMM|nr:MAG: ferredoxin--NADP+ reductase [Candidatus Kentron sp. MB]VFK30439.1 MAG: ferredoxin--NADP+ reductase [Candidatus Kentron sp. MB]VFK75221.1 MAG: ferredoxin--NADP+ reductase [Candidatus Kentron sp. MB]